MKKIETKDPSKVVIVPKPPQNPTQKSETVEPEKTQTESEEEKPAEAKREE